MRHSSLGGLRVGQLAVATAFPGNRLEDSVVLHGMEIQGNGVYEQFEEASTGPS